MIRIFVLALLAVGALVSPVRAQSAKIFVASTGNDANDGGRATPKRSFQAAHDAVAAGGEIVVLDTAGYGALVINKSVAITVPPGVDGFVTVSGYTNAISIQAGASDIVVLRGLILEGGDGVSSDGIFSSSVGILDVSDTTIRDFAAGINMVPSSTTHLRLRGGVIRDTKYGVLLQASSASVDAVITDVSIDSATKGGIEVISSEGTSAKADVKHSVCHELRRRVGHVEQFIYSCCR